MKLVTRDKRKEVEEFVRKCQKARTQEEIELLEKEGVFTGSYAINPLTKEKIPVWAGNFVLADYGCGMVMAVSGHDQRDFEFAKRYNLPIKLVIQPKDKMLDEKTIERAFVNEGILINSEKFSGMESKRAQEEISKYLENCKLGRQTVNYKIRDWLISRQRYWGTPIPIIYCEKCGIVPVPEKDLPVLLPEKVDFSTSGNPLITNKNFVNVKCPKCGGQGERETDTMGGFVDSSWYFLRYCDNKNKKEAFDTKKVDYWMPVDQYIGGAEHAVMHLIYARFFTKALRDMGFIKIDEPFLKLFNQGIVYKSGAKMSKSKGNVVTQEEISKKYGIDAARLFLMFVASPDKQMEWSDEGIEGSFRIINKLINLKERITQKFDTREESKINITIKEVSENIDKFEYPKAIIAIVKAVDSLSEKISEKNYKTLLKLISPFCPHIAEEIWHKLGNKTFISLEKWPECDESKINLELEQQEQQVEKTVSDINNILRILESRNELKGKKKVKIFAIPSEVGFYLEAKERIKKSTNMQVEVFDIKEASKIGKAVKAKLGKPGIFIE